MRIRKIKWRSCLDSSEAVLPAEYRCGDARHVRKVTGAVLELRQDGSRSFTSRRKWKRSCFHPERPQILHFR
jgi:hypothetical protein